MKKVILVTFLVAMFAVSLVSAGTISVSTTAPSVNGADILNLATGTGAVKLWTDTRAIGQTFTTGSNGGTLSSITLQHKGSSPGLTPPTKTYAITLGEVAGNTYSSYLVYEETFVQNTNWINDDYVTFVLSSPLDLAPNTQYGFDIAMKSSTSGWGAGIPYMWSTSDLYSGDQQFASTLNKQTTSPFNLQNGDKVFHLDITACSAEVCNDGVDNDCDGDIDSADLDCCTATGAEVCSDGQDNDCDGKVDDFDPDCFSYGCYAPNNLGDTTAENIEIHSGLSLQQILDAYAASQGYPSIDAVNDQTNTQVWEALGEATLEVKFVEEQGQANAELGWYDVSTGTFNSIFTEATASKGDTFTVTIPRGSTIGFSLDSTGYNPEYVTYTENSRNPTNKKSQDTVLVYAPLDDEFILAFEDLGGVATGGDFDYNDFIVSVKILDCQACTDSDNDSFSVEGGECGVIDCNDNDASINPAATELCNGIDEDCDDAIDNGFNIGLPCSVGVGECANDGEFICALDEQSTVCSATPGIPGVELCDAAGLDENCDGSSNEGCACTVGETQQCGPSTDVGACEFGTQTCNINGQMGDCIGAVYPELYDTVGNSVDEDCNGDVVCSIPCIEDPNTKRAECGSNVGGWRTHGMFVSCVSNYADELFLSNVITQEEADAMVETAAQSDIGQKFGTLSGYAIEGSGKNLFCNLFGWFC